MEKKTAAPHTLITGNKVTFGTHIVADFWGVSVETLDSPDKILEVLSAGVRAAGATIIDTCVHHFAPYGVTATVTLAESHICLHSWPEHSYCALDIFVCGEIDATKALIEIRGKLKPERENVLELIRGDLPEQT